VETAAIHHPEVPPAGHQAAGRPGDDYNTRFSWNDVLAPHGWQLVTERQGVGYWQKPGASGKEHHATTNYKGSDCLYVFSPLTSLPHKQGLTKFAAYTYLNHDGDFSAATKLLAAEGYVSSPPTVSQSHNAIEWPEPVSLPYGLHPVETFDFDLLPSTLRPWAQDICERVQCPPDFVAVGIMVGLGSLIGRKVGIRPQGLTDWVVTANQWGLVVGRPGVMKSPALEQALTPLKRLAAKANEQYTIALAQYELQAKAAELRAAAAKRKAADILRDNPQADLLSVLSVPSLDVPTLNRYISTDSTPEALGELLRHNPNGVLVHRDELVSLLKGLDREGREEGRGFYLTGWNGDSSYTFDRIGRGMNLHIPAVCISLLGGTQPGRLAEYIHHAVKGGSGDDGLLQRFGLLVWPDTEGEWKDVDRWPDNDAKLAAYNVFDYLDAIDTETVGAQQDTDGNGQPEGIPYLRFDPGALSLFHEWRSGLESRLRSGELHPALESHLAKYRKLIPGLALIIHLSDRETGSVTERATRQALAWSRYLETHARRAYGSATQPEIDAAKAILKHIRRGDLHDGFSARDAYRNGWAHLADREQVFSGLQLLVDYDWLRDERRTDTGGRHATVYIVNPRGLP
jgi:putative DNA primase/helicase